MANKIGKILCIFLLSLCIINNNIADKRFLNPEIGNIGAIYYSDEIVNSSKVEEDDNYEYIEIVLVFILSAGIGALLAYLLQKKKTK